MHLIAHSPNYLLTFVCGLWQKNDMFELVVQGLEPGGPAQTSGIMLDDIIESVNGSNVLGKTVRDVVPIIAGPEGTIVSLTVLRGPNRSRSVIHVKRAKRTAVSSTGTKSSPSPSNMLLGKPGL